MSRPARPRRFSRNTAATPARAAGRRRRWKPWWATPRPAKFIDDERKKLPKTTGEKSLDDALNGMIREHAKAKGFEVPTAEKK